MLAGEEGHHPSREQQPDEQRQAPVGRPRRHDTESVRPQLLLPTLGWVRRSSFLALLLAAVTAAGGCDLGSDGEDGSGERRRAAEGGSDGVSASIVQRLRRGGYVLAFRHAATDFSMTDSTRDLRDCSRQRNL